jgi:hypothetical protein
MAVAAAAAARVLEELCTGVQILFISNMPNLSSRFHSDAMS